MRYLRMLTNSVLAGLLGAAYVAVILLQINPQLPLEPATLLSLYAPLALFYGLNLAVVFYALIVLRQLVGARVLSPGWLSVRLLAWLSTGVAAVAALVTWLNLRGYQPVLDEETARRMAVGAAALAASSVVMLAVAVVHYSFGRRGSRVGGALLALTIVASLALPLAARGPGRPLARPSGPVDIGAVFPASTAASRVWLVLLDGASLDYVATAAAEGRLPNFGRILDAGAAMHLATLRPTQPEPIWTAVATGKYPPRNGVRSAAAYHLSNGEAVVELLPDYCFAYALVHLGFLTGAPHTSAALRARPLWQILSEMGVSVGLAGWPLTHPAPAVQGFVVGDRFYTPARGSEIDERSLYPGEALAEARTAVAAAAAGASGSEPLMATALAQDRAQARAFAALTTRYGPQFRALRYQVIDAAGHGYLRYAVPRDFGDVSDAERRRYGQVLERAYGIVDAQLGTIMSGLARRDVLLVVSGFGMQPISLPKRLLGRLFGDPDFSGTHEGAPDGFLLAVGARIDPGRPPLGSVVDVAPTVLYYLGLPVARDMDGHARTDLFRREFTAERPITFIPTYER
jgi:hypothetical protein